MSIKERPVACRFYDFDNCSVIDRDLKKQSNSKSEFELDCEGQKEGFFKLQHWKNHDTDR